MIKNTLSAGCGVVLALCLGSCAAFTAKPAAEKIPEGFQGIIEFDERQLAFEFPGRVAGVEVREGALLQAGQVVATLDSALESALTEVRVREAAAADEHVTVVQAGNRAEEFRALEARIRAAQAVEGRLQRNLEREQSLNNNGVTPRAMVEDLASDLQRAVAEREALEQNLKLLKRGARTQDVSAAQAQAQTAQAALRLQQERVEHYVLRAPIAGEVLAVHLEPGEMAASGAPVMALADTQHPYVDVFVPQAQVAGLHVGAKASVRTDGLANPATGSVEFVSSKTEFTPRFLFSTQERPNLVVRVRIRVEDPQRVLHAGVPAFAKIEAVPLLASAP